MLLRTRLFLPIAIVLITVSAPTYILAQCGVERWSVKTGTDADAGLVNLNSSTNSWQPFHLRHPECAFRI